MKKEAYKDKIRSIASLHSINADCSNRKKDKLSKPTKHLVYSTNLTTSTNPSIEASHLSNNTAPEIKVHTSMQSLILSLSKYLSTMTLKLIHMTSENSNVKNANTNQISNDKESK